MSATTWAECESANRTQGRAIMFPRRDAAPIEAGAEVSVMVLCGDPVIAAGLSAVLQEEPSFQVVSRPEPDDLARDVLSADVVVADYETALRLARNAQRWARKLVVFTNYESKTKICRVLESGASGYLLYGVRLPELFEGIRAVYRGGVALSPLAATRMTNRIQGRSLTPRERAVLGQLMFGLRNKAIARKLNVSEGTIKTHVKAILEKLDADSRTAAVMAAQRRGLLS